MGWEGGLRGRGTYEYSQLIHLVVWQNPTQHCKAIICQLKILKIKKRMSGVWNTRFKVIRKLLNRQKCPKIELTSQVSTEFLLTREIPHRLDKYLTTGYSVSFLNCSLKLHIVILSHKNEFREL